MPVEKSADCAWEKEPPLHSHSPLSAPPPPPPDMVTYAADALYAATPTGEYAPSGSPPTRDVMGMGMGALKEPEGYSTYSTGKDCAPPSGPEKHENTTAETSAARVSAPCAELAGVRLQEEEGMSSVCRSVAKPPEAVGSAYSSTNARTREGESTAVAPVPMRSTSVEPNVSRRFAPLLEGEGVEVPLPVEDGVIVPLLEDVCVLVTVLVGLPVDCGVSLALPVVDGDAVDVGVALDVAPRDRDADEEAVLLGVLVCVALELVVAVGVGDAVRDMGVLVGERVPVAVELLVGDGVGDRDGTYAGLSTKKL